MELGSDTASVGRKWTSFKQYKQKTLRDGECTTMQIKSLRKPCTELKMKEKNTAIPENQANFQETLLLYLHHFEVTTFTLSVNIIK